METDDLVTAFTEECESKGTELLDFLRQFQEDRTRIYDSFRVAVFRGLLTKAQLFFAYGSCANEFEAFIGHASTDRAGFCLDGIDVDHVRDITLREYPFSREDLEFYLECRRCFPDFQTTIVLIERYLWAGTFQVLRQNYGTDWILSVDNMKRRSWAQIREDFRSSAKDMPIHEFSSIPDLRDIILSTQHWRLFNEHLPKNLADKKVMKRMINELLVPSRNKVFHPTRSVSLTYSEFGELRSFRDAIHPDNWRGLLRDEMSCLTGALPIPQTY